MKQVKPKEKDKRNLMNKKKKSYHFLVCSSKVLLSQVIKLRASSWSSSPAVGASETSFDFPPDNGYSFPYYGLGLVGYLFLDKITCITYCTLFVITVDIVM